MEDNESGGPYLQAAVFCENVIEDRQGVLSLIRIIDRTVATATGQDAPEKMPPLPISAQMVLCFKSGLAKGSFQVKIRPRDPDGKNLPEVSLPMHLDGDDRGTNLILPVRMVVDREGVYWFSIYVGEALFTRMPFRVIYQRISIQR